MFYMRFLFDRFDRFFSNFVQHGDNRYLVWMANMLRIEHPMVVFCEASSIPLILAHRSSEMTRVLAFWLAFKRRMLWMLVFFESRCGFRMSFVYTPVNLIWFTNQKRIVGRLRKFHPYPYKSIQARLLQTLFALCFQHGQGFHP